MIGNLSKVQERLRTYAVVPDKRFTVKSGRGPNEEAIKQKVRQYWADDRVANVKKLEGLNISLAGFDPRKTSNKQLREIAEILADRGMIDADLAKTLSGIDLHFDAQGKEIDTDLEVDAYAFFDRELGALRTVITDGNETAKAALLELKTSISIMIALEEYAKAPRTKSLVNIRA